MSDAWMAQAMVLGGLGFLLVTLVLYILAERYRQAIARHDLLLEAQATRRAFDEAVEEQRERVEGGKRGRGVAGTIGPTADEMPLQEAA